MAKVGHPIKFGIRLTSEERTQLEGMIHCGKGPINSALKARILLNGGRHLDKGLSILFRDLMILWSWIALPQLFVEFCQNAELSEQSE